MGHRPVKGRDSGMDIRQLEERLRRYSAREEMLLRGGGEAEGADMPVAEVIGRCGYQNMNFFYRKFKKAEGCTPLEYRRRIRRP